jgi:hypothetical protein
MIIFIDLTTNKIEIDGCEDPELDVQKTLRKIAKNIDKYEVEQVSIKKEMEKMINKIISNRIVIKGFNDDVKPRETKDK